MSDYIYKKLSEDCELSGAEIAAMSNWEKLDTILSYEGILDYTDDIIYTVEQIWGIDL